MYSILLVDSDSRAAESLKNNIDWEKNGYKVIGPAANGAEACKLITIYRPDFVITEIMLPDMNGFDFIKKVRESGESTQFIILSNYAEFAYAQKALNYKVLSYCIKPVDEVDILSVLNKARSPLEYISSNITRSFIEMAADSKRYASSGMQRILHGMGMDVAQGDMLYLAVSLGKGTIRFQRNIEHVMIDVGNDRKVYLLKENHISDLKNSFEKGSNEEIISIGVSSGPKHLNELGSAFSEALSYAYGFFITGRKGIYESASPDLNELSIKLNELEKSIKRIDAKDIDKCFLGFKVLFGSGLYNIKHLAFVYFSINSFLFTYTGEYCENNVFEIYDIVENYKNAGDMLDCLKNKIVRGMRVISKFMVDGVDNHLINAMLDYINANFYKQITIQNLSQKFYLSPNYISYLFKKEVGENFTEYLSRIRINYAGELLRDSCFTIQSISEKCGYSEYFYFTRLFKKTVGVTPTQYRMQYKKTKIGSVC